MDITLTKGRVRNKQANRLGLLSSILYDLKYNKLLFLMLLPSVLFILVFAYFPMAGLVVAFKDYNFRGGIFNSPWSGFNNFEFLITSGAVTRMTVNTIFFNALFISTNIILQVAFAILLNEAANKLFNKVSKTAMFFPYFLSWVVVGAFVYNMFNYDTGFLNTVIKSLGHEAIDWYSSPGYWRWIVLAFQNWKWLGYGVVIYTAYIVNIDTEFYEAAYIDGANKVQQIRYITIPLMIPIVTVLFLMAIGNILRADYQMFYQIIGNNGLLLETTEVIDTFVTNALLFRGTDVGMASAAGFYQSVFGFVIVMLSNWAVRKASPENALF